MDHVEVPYGDNPTETATVLLAAAEKLDLPADVVRTTGDGTFLVPQEVADEAGIGSEKPQKAAQGAKKTAAKKTTRKRTSTRQKGTQARKTAKAAKTAQAPAEQPPAGDSSTEQ